MHARSWVGPYQNRRDGADRPGNHQPSCHRQDVRVRESGPRGAARRGAAWRPASRFVIMYRRVQVSLLSCSLLFAAFKGTCSSSAE